MKDLEMTCNQCGKKKKQSEIKLPKGYMPTFVDGYYRCLECFEVDTLYNWLVAEIERLKRENSVLEKENEILVTQLRKD